MHARRVRLGPSAAIGFVVASVLLAGCLSAPAANLDEGRNTAPPVRPPVVALIDTGINPYHAAFAASPLADAAELAEATGARGVPITRDQPFELAVEKDRELLDAIEEGELFHFPGTRVLAVSFHRYSESLPVLDTAIPHGTRTASLVARDAPHAVLVMLQVDVVYCDAGEGCLYPPSAAAAMEWAAAQPWIDVVSVSLELIGNTPDPEALHSEAARYRAASHEAAASGKLVVTAAGNEGAPTIPSYYCGPSWVLCVGGAEQMGTGDVVHAGRGVDVVANWSEVVAHQTHESERIESRGTSFATPIVAAIAAETIWHARHDVSIAASDPVELAGQVRHAINATAQRPSPLEWRPQVRDDPIATFDTISVPAILPAGQIGWGYLHAGLIPQVIANLDQPPEEGTPRAMVQARYQQAREEYWSRQ